jgi:uncharacterized membrane protein HdeD (DUF308 family)
MNKSDTILPKLPSLDTIKIENDKLLYTSLFFGIIEITSGILMFINKTMFWGTISYMIGVFFQCLIVLSTMSNLPVNTSFLEKLQKMYEKGIFMFIYILLILGVYIACISHSSNNIANNEMPSQWTWYARIIGVILSFVVTPILHTQMNSVLGSNTDTKDNQQKGIIVSHFLLIFVYIQYIISFYYQTDGFTV